jgi:hypothetical protein
MRAAVVKRFLLCIGIGLLMAIPFTELTFRWQGNTTSRPARTVTIDIPAGTSAKVDAGQKVLPQDFIFVVGDVLLVRNQDSVVHTLGPLVVPPGGSASMALNHLGNLSYVCSFEPTRYLGLNVQAPLTLGTRLEGIAIAGIPMGMLIGLYSLILRPLKRKDAAQLAP